MGRNDGPDWVRESVVTVRDEIVRFVATFFHFLRHPQRFAAAWYEGKTRALNPAGFLSTSLAVTAATRAVLSGLLGTGRTPDDGGLWSTLGDATLPYVYYIALGVLCHPILRLFGSKRPLRATVAIALFSGGGPGLLLILSMYLQVAIHIALVGSFHGSLNAGLPAWYMPIGGVLTYGPFATYALMLASGLRGLHAARRWQAAIAIAMSLLTSAYLLGVLHRALDFDFPAPHLVMTSGYDPSFDVWF
jgi:hypothetical protein